MRSRSQNQRSSGGQAGLISGSEGIEKTDPSVSRHGSRIWLAYLGVMGFVSAAYLFGARYLHAPAAFNSGWVFNFIGLSSVAAIVIGVRRSRVKVRLPWYLFALGQALFVSGDILAYNYKTFFHVELPFPSIADILYLAVYLCLVIGILIFIRGRTPGKDRASMIDSLIVTVGVGILSWHMLIAPYVHQDLNILTKLISIAYPIMDILVLVVGVRLAVGLGKREPAYRLLLLSIVALLCTDSVYGWILLRHPYQTGGLLDLGWILFYLLWGAAALHPSMPSLSYPTSERTAAFSRLRLVILGGVTLISPATLMVKYLHHDLTDLPVLVAGSVALFFLVVARMAGLVRENEQAAVRERALRDAGVDLVGATNRAAIHAAALSSARTLAGNGFSVFLCGPMDRSDRSSPVIASLFAGRGDTPQSLGGIPTWAVSRLSQNLSVELTAEELEGGTVAPGSSLAVFPLSNPPEISGLLVLVGDQRCPRAIWSGLEALASQTALALDSAALSEDLVRKESEVRFASLVRNSSDVVAVIAPDTNIQFISPSVERILGYSPTQLEGKRFVELVPPHEALSFLSVLEENRSGAPDMIECHLLTSDGSWTNVEILVSNLLHDPAVRGIVLNTRDISDRKAFEEQLTQQAFYDSITGLPNRALFRDRVKHALDRHRRTDRSLAVLFLDLDDFKTINDSLGHAAGDLLLADVGKRLTEALRSSDTAARLGGDEFAVLIEDQTDLRVSQMAERIQATLKKPFKLDGLEVSTSASIGIAFARSIKNEGDVEELLRSADVAMYTAKRSGKGRHEEFAPEMHEFVLHRLELKADLQRAQINQEFELYYQPLVILETGVISGVEALIRWRHPSRGLISPGEFIPLAEETGLIVPIGRWVLEEATRMAKALQVRFPLLPVGVSVNLSARQLQRPETVAEIEQIITEAEVAPWRLVLEITESVMMQDMDFAIARLSELKKLGVRVAIDDFGTGYSSLNYIRQFPIDVLKIDKSFIDGLGEDEDVEALTGTIISLAQILMLRPVAEGIERSTQVEKLRELGCPVGQGFFFYEPLSEAELYAELEVQSEPQSAALPVGAVSGSVA